MIPRKDAPAGPAKNPQGGLKGGLARAAKTRWGKKGWMQRLPCMVLLVLLGGTNPATAQDVEVTRKSLAGMNGVRVIVEPFASEVERQGLTRAAVQTDAELRLRKAGIRILTEEEFNNDRGFPLLDLAAAISTDGARWGVARFVKLTQGVSPVRDANVWLPAVTWSVERVNGSAPPSYIARFVRDAFNDLMDQFVNAYLAMNPKK